MSQWQKIGAENNAHWCDLMVRSHLGEGVFSDDAWTSPTRTPSLFPDAVSLRPSPDVARLLSRIDASPGCTIKDSFAALDLSAHGFAVLLEAQWITWSASPGRPPSLPPGTTRITEPLALRLWENQWCAGDGPKGLFRADLLLSRDVAVIGCMERDSVVAGGIISRSAHSIGISNVFTRKGNPLGTWSALRQSAGAIFPGLPLIGYEQGEDLVVAQASGFRAVGPLKVWISDEESKVT